MGALKAADELHTIRIGREVEVSTEQTGEPPDKKTKAGAKEKKEERITRAFKTRTRRGAGLKN